MCDNTSHKPQRLFFGSNKTVVTFATPRELTCSVEREDKEFGTGTLNKSEAKLALEICIAVIQCHRNTYLLFSLRLQLTVLRLPRKHTTGQIFEKQKDCSQLGHSFCVSRGFDGCHTVLGKQRHRAQQHNNVYCADSRSI